MHSDGMVAVWALHCKPDTLSLELVADTEFQSPREKYIITQMVSVTLYTHMLLYCEKAYCAVYPYLADVFGHGSLVCVL